MVCSQMAVASETWVAEISPSEPRISVVPFSTSRPRMRAVALALIIEDDAMPVENIDVDMRGLKAVADGLGEGRNGDRIAADRAVLLDLEAAPGPTSAPFVVVADLFRQAEAIRLLQEYPERTVVGALEGVEDCAVQHDVLQCVLARLIGERCDATGVEDDPLLFVLGHAVHGLDQRLDHLGLGLGPVDRRKRGEPTGSEVVLQAGDRGLAEECGNGGHRGPFRAGEEDEGVSAAIRWCSIYIEQPATSTCAARIRSAYRKGRQHQGIKDDAMTTSLGAKIKRHRQEKGYSLDKLAELTDSSKSYIWELENRDTRKPSGEKLTRIAQALEVTTDYLLDDTAEPGDEVLKEAFFRKFSKLKPEDQEKIQQMIDMWGKKD